MPQQPCIESDTRDRARSKNENENGDHMPSFSAWERCLPTDLTASTGHYRTSSSYRCKAET
jgi:hypothetical protein